MGRNVASFGVALAALLFSSFSWAVDRSWDPPRVTLDPYKGMVVRQTLPAGDPWTNPASVGAQVAAQAIVDVAIRKAKFASSGDKAKLLFKLTPGGIAASAAASLIAAAALDWTFDNGNQEFMRSVTTNVTETCPTPFSCSKLPSGSSCILNQDEMRLTTEIYLQDQRPELPSNAYGFTECYYDSVFMDGGWRDLRWTVYSVPISSYVKEEVVPWSEVETQLDRPEIQTAIAPAIAPLLTEDVVLSDPAVQQATREARDVLTQKYPLTVDPVTGLPVADIPGSNLTLKINDPSVGGTEKPPTLEFPLFCDWAKPVCDFIDWMKQDPDPIPEDVSPDLTVEREEITDAILPQYGPKGCLINPLEFSALGRSVTIDMTPVCTLSSYISPLLLMLGGYIGIRIATGTSGRENA